MWKTLLGFGVIGAVVNSSIGGTLLIITVLIATIFSEPAICLFGFVAVGVVPRTILWYRNERLRRMPASDRPITTRTAAIMAFLALLGGICATVWFAFGHTQDLVAGVLLAILVLAIACNTFAQFFLILDSE